MTFIQWWPFTTIRRHAQNLANHSEIWLKAPNFQNWVKILYLNTLLSASPNVLRKDLCANDTKDLQNLASSLKTVAHMELLQSTARREASAHFNYFWDLRATLTVFRAIFCLSSVDLLTICPSNERGRLDGKLPTKLSSPLNKALCWDLRGHVLPMCVFSSTCFQVQNTATVMRLSW